MLVRETPPLSDPADPRATRLLDTLAELTAIGMDLARELRREVIDADGDPAADVGLRFSRIARAVRQSVALEARLADEQTADAQASETKRKREAEQRTVSARQAGFERKASAAYLFEQTALPAAQTQAERDFLTEGVSEWLFDTTDDEAFLDKPVSEIILQICKDLELQPDPALWTQEQWEADVRARYAHLDAAPLDAAPARAPPTVQQTWAARYAVLSNAATIGAFAHRSIDADDVDPPPPFDPAQTATKITEPAAGP